MSAGGTALDWQAAARATGLLILAGVLGCSTAFASSAPVLATPGDETGNRAPKPGEGDYAERAARLLMTASESGDELGTAQAQHALAQHMMVLSLWPQALIHAQLARDAARKSGDARKRLVTDITYGRILPNLERTAEATEVLLQALEQVRELGDVEQEQWALLGLSGAYLHARELEAAEQFTREGLALAQANGDRIQQVRFLNNLGLIAWTAGDVETAERYVRQATEVDVDNLPSNVHKTLVLASITLAGARSEGDAARARQIIAESQRDGSRYMEGFATEQLGRILCAAGDFDEALAQFAAAEPLFAESDVVGDLRRLHEHWAGCLASAGRHELAYARQQEATRMLEATQDRRQTDTLQALDTAFRTEHHLTELAQLASEEQALQTLLAQQRARTAWLVAGALLLLGIIYALAMRNRRLREQQHAAATLQQARVDLLARTSHEIRSPAQGIIGILEGSLADSHGQGNSRALTAALGGARMIGRLANDCLDLSMLEQGRLQLRLDQICHLPSFVEQMVTLGKATIASEHINVTARVAIGVPEHIHTDEERLAQVLLNLISNAAHYSSSGTIPLCVAVTSDGRSLEFAVIDQGPGLNANPEQLFDPYTRDDHLARNPRGTGLGLAISSRILRAMGGSIRASNHPEGGACFIVSLPLRIAIPPSPAPTPANAPTDAATSTDAPDVPARLRALVIDDDPFARLGLSTLLVSIGHEVLEAGSGENLEATLDVFNPQLVLVDQHLDGSTGTELATRIREHDHAAPYIRMVVIVSGSPRKDSGEHRHIDDWLIKPVGRQGLQNLLARLAAAGWRFQRAPQPPRSRP